VQENQLLRNGPGWWRAIPVSMSLLLAVASTALDAEAQGLKPGGLVSLPSASSGWTDFVQNGGLETVVGSTPTQWAPSPASAWKVSSPGHSGTNAYGFSNASGPEARQELFLEPGTYKFSGWMKTAGKGGSGSARFRVDFRPAGIQAWYNTPDVSGTTGWALKELTISIPASYADPSTGRVRTHVILDGYYARPGLSADYDDVKLERQNTLPVEAFMHHPNYRGTLFNAPANQDLVFRVTVKHSGALANPASYQVVSRITPEAGTSAIETLSHPLTLDTDAATGEKYIRVVANRPGSGGTRPISDVGSYLVTFELDDANGPVSGLQFPPYRVNKVNKNLADGVISFNEKNQVTIDGAPRFVLGVYDSGIPYSSSPAGWESTLWDSAGDRRMNGLKINMYLNYHFGDAPADAMNALMDNLKSHGVRYLQTGNCFSNFPASSHVGDGDGFEIDAKTPAYIVGTNGSADSPDGTGIAPRAGGYYVADECAANLVTEVFNQYKHGLNYPDTGLQTLDPDSITFGALFGDQDLVLWRDAIDVLSTDPYPLYGAEPSGGYPHIKVANWTALTRTAVQGARPFFTVLQFFKFDAGRRQGRWPTLQEMRNHAYMAITEGAQGLFWWSLGENGLASACRSAGWCAERTTYMNNLKNLVSELSGMENVLLADDTPQYLTSTNAAIRTKVKFVGGTGYVIAYNTTNTDGVGTTFGWATKPTAVIVNGTTSVPIAANGTFTDTFARYEARVYQITAPAP